MIVDSKPSVEVLTPKQHAAKFVKQMIEQKINLFKSSDRQKAFDLLAEYVVDNNIQDSKSIFDEVLNSVNKLTNK